MPMKILQCAALSVAIPVVIALGLTLWQRPSPLPAFAQGEGGLGQMLLRRVSGQSMFNTAGMTVLIPLAIIPFAKPVTDRGRSESIDGFGLPRVVDTVRIAKLSKGNLDGL